MADRSLRFTATLQPRGPAGAFILSDDQVEALGGGRKAFPVTLIVNAGRYGLRLARMGGENMIGLRREIREAAGLALGDVVEIEVALDDTERTVEVPADLAAALAADANAEAAVAKMALTHRKEYIRWVTEAKRDATRLDRIAKTVTMVKAGRTR